MAFDTSFLVGNAPAPILNPLDIAIRKQQYRNALSQQAEQDLRLQQEQQAIADQQRTDAGLAAMARARMASAPAPMQTSAPAPMPAGPPMGGAPPGAAPMGAPATGGLPFDPSSGFNPQTGATPPAAPPPPAAPAASPVTFTRDANGRPKTPSFDELVTTWGIPPARASAVLKSFQDTDEKDSQIQEHLAITAKNNADLNTAVQDHVAGMAAGIIKSEYNPAVIKYSVEQFSALGAPYAKMAQGIVQQLQANPASAPAIFQQLATASDKQRAAASAETTATATATEKGAIAAKTTQDTARANEMATYSRAAGATNQAEWNAAVLRPDASPAAAKELSPIFSQAAAAHARNLSMTGEQQATTQQTAAYQNAQLQQGAQRIGLEQQNVGLAQKRLSWEKGGGGSLEDPDYMRGVVAGAIQINPRDKNFAATAAAARAIDPDWTSDRYSNAQHMRQSLTSGPLGKKLESFNQLTSHLGELRQASDDLGHNVMQYTPGVVSQFSGPVKRYTDAQSTAGAELATTLAQGQATQHEVATATANLGSGSPDVRAQGIQQYTRLIGGRLRAVAKNYAAATGDVFPVDQYVDSDAVRELTKNGVNPYDIAEQEKPHWMKSKEAAPPGAPAPAPGALPAAPAPAAVSDDIRHASTDDLLNRLNKAKR